MFILIFLLFSNFALAADNEITIKNPDNTITVKTPDRISGHDEFVTEKQKDLDDSKDHLQKLKDEKDHFENLILNEQNAITKIQNDLQIAGPIQVNGEIETP